MTFMVYCENDKKRPHEPDSELAAHRTDWRRDYGRIIHSSAFRRLQGKTQLYPGLESDFFRNRLTHSLEVAEIAKSITLKLNNDLKAEDGNYIEPDIVECAALAHDLGHAPFGHIGERALNQKMVGFGGFEGNAQALRIVSKIEKKILADKNDAELYGIKVEEENGVVVSKDCRVGLNLTYRTLAAVLKYDDLIEYSDAEKNSNVIKPKKGFYETEKELVDNIKQHVAKDITFDEDNKFKTIECSIMDIADDITYSVYDMEDAFRARFISPSSLMSMDEILLREIAAEVQQKFNDVYNNEYKDIDEKYIKDRLFHLMLLFNPDLDGDEVKMQGKKESKKAKNAGRTYANLVSYLTVMQWCKFSDEITDVGYNRAAFTTYLIDKFIKAVKIVRNNVNPQLSHVIMNTEEYIDMLILKKISYYSQIQSPKIKIFEYRGKQIIDSIFECLTSPNGYEMLPHDFRIIHDSLKEEKEKKRIICDFIAGMTDRYASEFYSKLYSENPQTIFKAI